VDELNLITGAVIAPGVRIHRKLGYGLLASVYEVVLARDLVRLGFMKVMILRLGLVMNFGMATMKAKPARKARPEGLRCRRYDQFWRFDTLPTSFHCPSTLRYSSIHAHTA
jgi:hypothetical protein